MAKAEASIEELVGIIERGALRPPKCRDSTSGRQIGFAISWTRFIAAIHREQFFSEKPISPFHFGARNSALA
jgi:hypothetical protein